MNATAKVAELEKTLVSIHKSDPRHKLLVMQLCAITRTAIKDANAAWRRHDKRHTHERLPDLFLRE
jgi:hypothetical protein